MSSDRVATYMLDMIINNSCVSYMTAHADEQFILIINDCGMDVLNMFIQTEKVSLNRITIINEKYNKVSEDKIKQYDVMHRPQYIYGEDCDEYLQRSQKHFCSVIAYDSPTLLSTLACMLKKSTIGQFTRIFTLSNNIYKLKYTIHALMQKYKYDANITTYNIKPRGNIDHIGLLEVSLVKSASVSSASVSSAAVSSAAVSSAAVSSASVSSASLSDATVNINKKRKLNAASISPASISPASIQRTSDSTINSTNADTTVIKTKEFVIVHRGNALSIDAVDLSTAIVVAHKLFDTTAVVYPTLESSKIYAIWNLTDFAEVVDCMHNRNPLDILAVYDTMYGDE